MSRHHGAPETGAAVVVADGILTATANLTQGRVLSRTPRGKRTTAPGAGPGPIVISTAPETPLPLQIRRLHHRSLRVPRRAPQVWRFSQVWKGRQLRRELPSPQLQGSPKIMTPPLSLEPPQHSYPGATLLTTP